MSEDDDDDDDDDELSKMSSSDGSFQSVCKMRLFILKWRCNIIFWDILLFMDIILTKNF